ncbi:phage protease [Ectopseudomonas mendocina]|uniref:phage protease n=1 Tax=Ectopseudomonas mendocina TaxID=300 RepID=UPI0009B88F6D|nr:phage protease [Pseudomonas mendocina]VEE17575.1 protease (I) and scaffold (Z) protein [Pseudomonas mendocina]
MNTQNAPHNRTTSTALCFELSADVPEWVEVLPPGPTVTGRDGRTWSYDPAQVLAATKAHTAGADLPFDYVHATELKAPQGDDAPASGWAREYRINERGAIEARVEWTAKARNAIAEREYRYISPVFTYDDDGRIHRFSSFGLVNKPNLLTKALNAEQPTTENIPMLAAAIRAALGLPETATEDEAVAAIKALKEAKETALNSEKAPSLQLYVPRGDYNALEQRALNAEQKLKQREEDELKTAINTEIDAALKAGKITPATKGYHLAACQEEGGLERFREFVKAAPSVTATVVPEGRVDEQNKTALNAEQQQAARSFGMTDDQYIKHIEGQ